MHFKLGPLTTFVWFLIISSFTSCLIEEELDFHELSEEIENQGFSDSLMLWQRIKDIDSLQYTFRDPIYYDDQVIMHKNQGLITNMDDVIYALDSKTGELLWEWNDWIEYQIGTNSLDSYSVIENKMIFANRNKTYCINLDNGQTIWKNDENNFAINGRLPLSSWRENIFYVTTDNNLNIENKSVYIHNITNNNYKKIFTINNDSLDVGIITPNVELNEFGDTILYIKGYLFDNLNYDAINGTHTSIFMSAFNISKQEYSWKRDSIAYWNIVRKNPPIILDQSVIITTSNKIISFDKKTGEILWENEFEFSFTSCNYTYGSDKIFVRDNFSKTFAVDALTGQTLWENENTSRTSFCGLRVFEDHLYVGTHNIDIINIASGQTIFRIEPHNHKLDSRAMFLFTIPALSKNGEYIFTSDTFFDISYENPVYK